MRDLGTLPGGIFSEPKGINRLGHVCGFSDGTAGLFRSFLWTRAAGMLDLGALPNGTYSLANGINNLDEVVGYGDVYGATHAYFWNGATGMQDLGTLPASSDSDATAINDLSQVVGYASLISVGNHAFIWSKSTGMLDLNNLIDPNLGWALNIAYGINVHGQITGVGTIHGLVHAFLLTPKN